MSAHRHRVGVLLLPSVIQILVQDECKAAAEVAEPPVNSGVAVGAKKTLGVVAEALMAAEAPMAVAMAAEAPMEVAMAAEEVAVPAEEAEGLAAGRNAGSQLTDEVYKRNLCHFLRNSYVYNIFSCSCRIKKE